ncbi:hypothetical protein [Enterococcus sp. DIV0876]|uniref:hypothetical protein n=1 Tax=Enterococcus sp. DIV0876 TaxID=2774633 RepID=UPI003D2FA3FB
MKQEESTRARRQERVLKLQRLLYLTQLNNQEISPSMREERDKLRAELWKSDDLRFRIVEVLYKGEVIYSGTRTDVAKKCKKAKGTLTDLLRKGTPDKQGRKYRYKDWRKQNE